MAVLIDARVPLRSPLELAGLVSAVVAASSNGETDWLEWKSSLDLAQEAHVAIARQGPLRSMGGCGTSCSHATVAVSGRSAECMHCHGT